MFLHFLQTKEDKLAFLELAHVVANADGFVNRKERQYLKSYMDEMGIEQSEISLSADRKLPDIIGGLRDEQVKNIFFAEILLLIFADGDYNDEEKQIAGELKRQFGFSDEAYESFKGWVVRMDSLRIEGLKMILEYKR
ncbi:TerB family tellurite resistance protein [Paenibacillus arenilitoris]|uniref:TerB family tellurite resistance protein n=1 Tax=Paenibacillus arenilitoris TaxID=2772299 RepID=A0A927H6X6_9BACL|nr:TerB family tellurite resistance protein [Paenibacillus arenilitoris]MBD2869957.1 TerB family tellurite resistance protein [Paenibacillus arenilitoris]